jgi:putative GTP pyrophosphokinase
MNEVLREKYAEIVKKYDENIEPFENFSKNLKIFFEGRSLKNVVHTVRYRVKDIDHLLEKIERKNLEDSFKDNAQKKGNISSENIFQRITDIAGVRVLHLHFSQFEQIHNAIMNKVREGEYILVENPKAYTWDPESDKYFKQFDLQTEIKESFYTSIHYVLKPNSTGIATCEVQVRTLLEEVWGEIDHTMNYPKPTMDEHCKEQIRVLARLVGAGSHLANSIMKRFGSS